MDPILKKFLEKTSAHRNKIRKILLFGSRARGDERPDSDYDLLILMEKRDQDLINHLYDAVVDCLLEFGRVISLKIFTTSQWNYLSSLQTLFSQNVSREGIPLG